MNRKFYLETLQPADRLVIPKNGLRLVQHHAIYLGKDNNGNRVYIENAITAHPFGKNNLLVLTNVGDGLV